jgi:trans-aconitate 2-methyltransferase
LTTGVASADPARILDPSTRAASADRARVADSSTGDAVAVGQGDQPSAVRDETSSGLAADAPATVDGGTRERVGGTRERVGGAVRAGGSSPALPEAGKDGGSSPGLAQAGEDGGSSPGLAEAGKDGGSSAGLPEADQGGGELRFSVGDLAEWMPDRPVDVIFSNAALQWVPGHRQLLPRWVEALAPGGRLAFSMPGNFEAPSHRVLRELCESPRWRDRLGQVNRHDVVGDPADYFKLLSDLGCEVDAWETTYVQVLHGADPVLEWMKGTALRPAFDALPDEAEREEFVAELTALLREAYPSGPYGTLFPFRRIFVIAGPAKSASGAS